MRVSLLVTTLFGVQTFAFPTALMNGDVSAVELSRITQLADKIAAESRKRQAGLGLIDVGFDAKAQKVDTSGQHAYVSRIIIEMCVPRLRCKTESAWKG